MKTNFPEAMVKTRDTDFVRRKAEIPKGFVNNFEMFHRILIVLFSCSVSELFYQAGKKIWKDQQTIQGKLKSQKVKWFCKNSP